MFAFNLASSTTSLIYDMASVSAFSIILSINFCLASSLFNPAIFSNCFCDSVSNFALELFSSLCCCFSCCFSFSCWLSSSFCCFSSAANCFSKFSLRRLLSVSCFRIFSLRCLSSLSLCFSLRSNSSAFFSLARIRFSDSLLSL